MSSPFVYDEPVEPGTLIDRREELAALTERLGCARNSRLEGPRRFGKTSLIRAALKNAEHHGAIAIEVNFLGCVTAADVADRIERAYSAQLDGVLRQWFTSLVRTLRPTVSVTPGGIGVSAQLQPHSGALLDRLALPRRVYEKSGRPCAIAFDEFQEVLRVGSELPGVFRSELEGQGPAAGYIFSGSHPGLMRELFADRRHAFFAQAAPITVGPLPLQDLGDYVAAQFVAGRRDVGDALGPLLDASEGHPQRAMLLAHHLYERVAPGASADVEDWAAAEHSAQREASSEIEVLWNSATALERRVLKIVAHRTLALAGTEAQQRFGVIKGRSVQVALERLASDGHLINDAQTRTGWRVVDPFLARWLRDTNPDR